MSKDKLKKKTEAKAKQNRQNRVNRQMKYSGKTEMNATQKSYVAGDYVSSASTKAYGYKKYGLPEKTALTYGRSKDNYAKLQRGENPYEAKYVYTGKPQKVKGGTRADGSTYDDFVSKKRQLSDKEKKMWKTQGSLDEEKYDEKYSYKWGGGKNANIFLDNNLIWHGCWTIEENTMAVELLGRRWNHGQWINEGAYLWHDTWQKDNLITVRNSVFRVQMVRALKPGWGGADNNYENYGGKFIEAYAGARVVSWNNDIVGFYRCYYGWFDSMIYSHDNKGHVYVYATGDLGASLWHSGWHPYCHDGHWLGALSEYRYVGTNHGAHNSWFNPKSSTPPPAYTPTLQYFENNFGASALWTTPEGSGSGTSSRSDCWGQGHWGSYKNHRGYARFDNINAWAHGGQDFRAYLTMTRLNTNHGNSANTPVPKILRPDGSYWSCGVGFARGQTHTIELPSDIVTALVTGGWTQLQMFSTTTADYSFYNNVNLRITMNKYV